MAQSTLQEFEHASANATGLLDTRFEGQPLVHFRGIKYASIPERFAAPVPVERDIQKRLQATKFGPRCPQLPVDVRDLMQIPKDLEQWPPETEDELECLNLCITAPEKVEGKLPVLIWIYGGAQVVSFSSSAHRLCETGPFAAQAIASGQPLILVNPNYRLNVFAYGDGQPGTEKNLHVQDLQAAVHWTVDNIAAFGGDPSRITIAGESAGSILTHALCMALPQSISVQRAILCSGSIRTSRFQPPSFFEPTLNRVLKTIRSLAAAQKVPNAEEMTLRTAPVPLLVAAMASGAMNSIPLQQSDIMVDGEAVHGSLERLEALMIGDCEFEGVLWLHGVRLLSDGALRECFLGTAEHEKSTADSGRNNGPSAAAQRLTANYLDSSSTTNNTSALGLNETQAGALSFMADYLFHTANHDIISSLTSSTNTSSTKVYAYTFDEPNPFAASNPNPLTGVPRAHHGVDLLALWGTHEKDYPADDNGKAFGTIGKEYRARIIKFVGGGQPWSAVAAGEGGSYAYTFGLEGKHGEIDRSQYAEKRRVDRWEVMREVGEEVVDAVWGRLIKAVTVEVAKAMAAVAAARKKAEDGEQSGKKDKEKEATMASWDAGRAKADGGNKL